MKFQAQGTFEVAIKPQGEGNSHAVVNLGRMSLDKQFHGDLEAVGKGEMLSALTPLEGSAGYVAIERVIGTLNGRKGSFVLQHNGTMNRGEQQLSITVVPDSGTEELSGIAGLFLLTIQNGTHFYTLNYSLPD